MPSDESDPAAASELDAALSELMAQTRKEPVSKELRELAARLEAALNKARIAHDGLSEESC
ncbi:hypothetical protein [Paracoccus sp. S1E-3]|uniref:hypothetical protein n=1 Tax=Paracoccus sp. S1E-3 TaxID=2756130 RepID=UPI0015EF2578|nr:hypothetical protein [Paracoccus sp. S1E-3]MBA4491681.1 hypothetical protein [Paracoccus sp. S1E-3]